jgi:hypothetical protein
LAFEFDTVAHIRVLLHDHVTAPQAPEALGPNPPSVTGGMSEASVPLLLRCEPRIDHREFLGERRLEKVVGDTATASSAEKP